MVYRKISADMKQQALELKNAGRFGRSHRGARHIESQAISRWADGNYVAGSSVIGKAIHTLRVCTLGHLASKSRQCCKHPMGVPI
ncbi:hypothetical protein SCLCIDRAFT_1223541, partial [Scleroderma citrinum Foug A]